MGEIATALLRAQLSLRDPRLLWHVVWPALVSGALCLAVIFWVWQPLLDAGLAWFGRLFGGAWLEGEVVRPLLALLLKLGLFLLLLLLIYVFSVILVAVVGIPLMLERVGGRDYPDLIQRHGGSSWGSLCQVVSAGARFLLLLVLSLPLWLIPGLGLLISLLLTAWFNARTFSYDTLMLHADTAELHALPKQRQMPVFGLGLICALLAHAPLLNLLVPAFSALAFSHFMLEALRRRRAGECGQLVVEG